MSEGLNVLEQVLTIGPQIITAATGVTIFLKSTNSNPWASLALKVLKWLSGNVGNNRNADDI